MTSNTPQGLWQACDAMEAAAFPVGTAHVAPFEPAIRACYEAGVQAPTLVGKRHHEPDILASALFLKRTLGDLRSVWVLLRLGYTPQASAVAASLYENALAVNCLAGDTKNTAKFRSEKSGDLPWSPQQLAKGLALRWQAEAQTQGESFGKDDYELAWREVYSAYKWLCKIKHPTLRSVVHDSFASSARDGEYVVMAAPDLRVEDLPVKATVLAIAISRTREATRSFALALDCDISSEAYASFVERLNTALRCSNEAYRQLANKPLPFDIRDSSLAQEWASRRSRGAGE